MLVHDTVHERQGTTWTLRLGHYPKLRLSPEFVVHCLQARGLEVVRTQAPRGMVQIAAERNG
ncbi:MAG TPA: hypothetical protein VMF03_07480 [Steroidobacteraceae bacterium]|nr:hypothetical protein [Steroidobacteraceae bacterium]